MIKEICSHNECTGCSACVNVCSRNAISFIEDNLGFRYPFINYDQCVECGLCQIICPNNAKINSNKPSSCFVGHVANYREQKTSSSGGIASLLSRAIIHQGGVVYGCTAKDVKHVQHVRVNNEENLYLLKGSKYVQSDLGDCYKCIKTDLKSGLKVVFIGTPCQVAGLKAYLRTDYGQLITVDFVCHGVPSQRILNESLRSKTNTKLEDCNLLFRRKIKTGKKYESKYGLFLYDKYGLLLYNGIHPKDMYIAGFLCALFYRESCYQCKYAKSERVSDITLGDYADKDSDFEQLTERDLSLSMITLNTQKGERFFTELGKQNVETMPIEYSKLVEAQGQLRVPMKRHLNRDKFSTLFLNGDFDKDVKSLIKDDLKRIVKITRRARLKKILLHIPFGKELLNNKKK